MEVLPAIDLRSGKCVRLVQGEYHRQIDYEDDPIKPAKEFLKAGAKWVHVVDLDGARLGQSVNFETVKNICEQVDLKVEIGGGIRNEETIRKMLDTGVERVIIGTAAVENFSWFTEMSNKFPEKLALALDARGSKVATHGWTQDTPQKMWDFASQAANLPLSAIIYTDISKDGMMSGPNFERTKALVDAVEHDIIAAGGVTKIEDVRKLAETGLAGAIIGRAWYEGSIDLKEAIKAARKPE